MLLHADHGLHLPCRVHYRFLIQRLHTIHIQKPSADPLLLQQRNGIQGRTHHLPAGHKKHIRPFSQYRSLIHHKRNIIFAVNILHRISPHAQIGRPGILKQRLNELCRLEPIAWQINPHVWDCGHGCNILCGMMAHSQRPIAYAAADADQFYICIGVCHIDFALLIASG